MSSGFTQLRKGIDGVILESGRHRGTFLPQMWERLSDPWQFMSELKRKAGLGLEGEDAAVLQQDQRLAGVLPGKFAVLLSENWILV